MFVNGLELDGDSDVNDWKLANQQRDPHNKLCKSLIIPNMIINSVENVISANESNSIIPVHA